MQYLGLFAKYWQPGQVKSRLAKSIGPEPAAALYQTFLAVLLDRLAESADHRVLAYSPTKRRDPFRRFLAERTQSNRWILEPCWILEPQSAGDLGERMRHFFDSAFATGATRVVLIGTDSPNLPIETIEQAFAALDRSPVVLGPTTDGGYYLVGARNRTPPIFDRIAWSTPSVWQQTVDRLQSRSIPFQTLQEWYDVDNLADLRRLATDLSDAEDVHPALKTLRDNVARALQGERQF